MEIRAGLREHTAAASSLALLVTWSSGFIGSELGRRAHAVPVTLLGWRFVLLSSLLLTVALVRRTRLTDWRAWRRQGVLALLCQAGYLLLIFAGVARGVPAGTAAVIAAVQPLLVAAVAGSVLGERSTARTWVGMALGLVGVVVVVSGDLGVSDVPAWAFLLPTGGMLCLATGTVLERRLRPSEGLLEAVTMQAVVTAAVLTTVALLTGRAEPPATLEFWRAVLWLIVLASLGGYVLYVFVSRTQGATVVSTLLFLTPPTTMLWAYLMFGDRVTVPGLAGLAVSGVGVWLVLSGRVVTRSGPEAP